MMLLAGLCCVVLGFIGGWGLIGWGLEGGDYCLVRNDVWLKY